MKKLLSVVLACLMVFTLLAPSFAESYHCNCGYSPVIYVGPLGSASIVRDAGTPDAQTLWKINTPFVLSNAGAVLGDITNALLDSNYELLGDAVVNFVNTSFGDLALDENGDSKPNVTVPDLNTPENGDHGEGKSFYFNYDFRLDPYTHARRLKDVIEQVKALTGHNSVKLFCSSMGGVVLSAYLELYGSEGIDVIIARCAPFWGTAVAGELFCGKLSLTPTAIRRYAEDAIPFFETGIYNNYADDYIEGVLYYVVDVMYYSGILTLLSVLGDALAEKIIARIYEECLIPVFGSMPGLWSFVPAEYFDEALDFMKVSPSSPVYAQLMQYRVAQSNVGKNLNLARENGTRVAILCGYNVQRTPLVPSWENTSDGTVDTVYASLGAVCGKTKMPLDEAYLESVGESEYLSPDKMVDASACELRDCTWFIKNWLHCNGNPALDEFIELLMTSDEVSVSTFFAYPQFLEIDDNAETLTPVLGEDDALTVLAKNPTFLNYVKLLFTFVGKIFAFLGVKFG